MESKDKWFFKSGKGTSTKIIELLDFNSVARDMIKQFVLFPGHKRFKDILHLRSVIQLKAAVANHVSASGLSTLVPPSTIDSHTTMTPADKAIWDAAYSEEIQGLQANNTFGTQSPKVTFRQFAIKSRPCSLVWLSAP